MPNETRVFGIGLDSPFHIHLQIRANAQYGRCDFQSGGVMETFEMGSEEKSGAVEFGKGVGGFDDAVAKACQDGAVERIEDGILEDDVLDAVFLACKDLRY